MEEAPTQELESLEECKVNLKNDDGKSTKQDFSNYDTNIYKQVGIGNKDIEKSIENHHTFSKPFRLKWDAIYGDLVYERVYNKTLNYAIMYLSIMLLLELYFSNVIPRAPLPPNIQEWLGITLTFLYYGVYGIMVLTIALPVMYCNGLDRSTGIARKQVALLLYPVAVFTAVYFLWSTRVSGKDGVDSSATEIAFTAFGAFVYYFSYFYGVLVQTCSHFDKAISNNILYVRTLLDGIDKRHKRASSTFVVDLISFFTMRPATVNAVEGVNADVSVEQFFSTWKVVDILRDLIFHMPALLQLSLLVGVTALVITLTSLLKNLTIPWSWNDVETFLHIRMKNVTSTELDYAQEQYDDAKDSWNLALVISVCITGVIAGFALLWLALISVNVRHNLRTGVWRYNRNAYVSPENGTFRVYKVAYLPGMILGAMVFGCVLYVWTLVLIIFCLAFEPIRVALYNQFGGFIVSLCISVLIKVQLVTLIYDGWLVTDDLQIKNMNTFCIFFLNLFFIELIYGLFSAFYRILYYLGYCFVAIFRFDATLLPHLMWTLDSAFCSFNSYMLFEVSFLCCFISFSHVHFVDLSFCLCSTRRAIRSCSALWRFSPAGAWQIACLATRSRAEKSKFSISIVRSLKMARRP